MIQFIKFLELIVKVKEILSNLNQNKIENLTQNITLDFINILKQKEIRLITIFDVILFHPIDQHFSLTC